MALHVLRNKKYYASFSKTYYILHIAKCQITTKDTENASQIYISQSLYGSMYRTRCVQASKSVLIKLPHGSCPHPDTLSSYFKKFFNVKKVFTFQNLEQPYALCELETEENVKALLSSATYSRDGDVIPSSSRLVSISHLPKDLDSKSMLTSVKSSSSYLTGLGMLHDISQQMSALDNFEQLTEANICIRYFICSSIEDLMRGIFPHARVLPFGSSVNGFGKNSGDLDMTLCLNPLGHQLPTSKMDKNVNFHYCHSLHHISSERFLKQKSLDMIGELLKLYMPGFSHFEKILKARVPIVKFINDCSGLQCDLTFLDCSACYMAYFFRECSVVHPSVILLVRAVSWWARAQKLILRDNIGPTFSNFVMLSLTIHYLQSITIVPPFNSLNPDQKKKTNPRRTFSHLPPDELLAGFFEYFSTFPYSEQGISLLNGNTTENLGKSPLYMENPLDLQHNIAKNVSHSELDKFIKLCRLSLDVLLDSKHMFHNFNEPSWGLETLLLKYLLSATVSPKYSTGRIKETN